MATVLTNIELRCSHCATPLQTVGRPGYSLHVVPCPTCYEEDVETGRRKGFHEGYKEGYKDRKEEENDL